MSFAPLFSLDYVGTNIVQIDPTSVLSLFGGGLVGFVFVCHTLPVVKISTTFNSPPP